MDASRTGTVTRTRRTETSEMNEAEAIRLAQQGDAGAFERIYRLHSRRGYAVCLRMVGNTAEAKALRQGAIFVRFPESGLVRGRSAVSTCVHLVALDPGRRRR